jgi:hypothetical protein
MNAFLSPVTGCVLPVLCHGYAPAEIVRHSGGMGVDPVVKHAVE